MRQILGIAALICAAVIAFAQVDFKQQRSAGMSNAKQLAVGLLIYCADYDDVSPWAQDTATIQTITYPYIKNKSVWQTMNPAGSVFEYNFVAGGVNMQHMANPGTLVMYWETKPWPDGTRIVAFWDGHVKVTSDADWKKTAKLMPTKMKRSAKKPLPKLKLKN